MNCYFCKSLKHLSENCDKFPTLRSRYSKVGYCRKYCLCKNFDPNESKDCKCKTICDVCFQQHHVAFCPKKDPCHPSYVKIRDEDSIKLDLSYLPIWRRFMDLCNPIDKIKLQLTCKSLFSLQQGKFDYKLRSFLNPRSLKPNVIYNGYACITWNADIVALEEKNNNTFNLDSFYIINHNITATHLKILSRGDPVSVHLLKCEYNSNLEFQQFVNAFQYCIDFNFDYCPLPSTWIQDLLWSKRKVSLRKLVVRFATDANHLCKISDIVELLHDSEQLKIKILYDTVNDETFTKYILRWKLLNCKYSNDDNKNCNLIFQVCSSTTKLGLHCFCVLPLNAMEMLYKHPLNFV